MLDRLFLPGAAVLALAMIALALVWPQGLGARSPAPFGHVPIQQTAAMRAAMKREADESNSRIEKAQQAVRALQDQTLTPNP